MCGIAGVFGENISKQEIRNICEMCDMLKHRGPDGEGLWVDENVEAVLAHRRLSIVDLSENGKQPMLSKSKKYVISYNGEIYNCRELAKKLSNEKNVTFVGTSDTEVLLSHFEEYGILNTLENCRGMFAIALYDRAEKVLYLIRDRMGEKPLYYKNENKKIFFASELKCLRDGSRILDVESVNEFVKRGYVTGNKTIYKGIFKLRPGEVLCINNNGEITERVIYWNYKEKVTNREKCYDNLSLNDASTKLERILIDTISKQMMSDVPLGAFLSSGIDSTLVVSIMQRLSMQKVKTFTIGVKGNDCNEAEDAKKIAAYLGTEHTEFYVTEREIKDIIPHLPEIYSEPFGDASAIPTLLVSQLAKTKVSVALTGDGGDELFGGYPFYRSLPRKWRMISNIPCGMRTEFGKKILQSKYCSSHHELVKRGMWLQATSVEGLYDIMKYGLGESNEWCRDVGDNKLNTDIEGINDIANIMMYLDAVTYLPEDILVKTDRAAMKHSLETRAPLLDRDIVEFACNISTHNKISNTEGKLILKDILNRYIPNTFLAKTKKGFSIPISKWLLEDKNINEWAYSLMNYKHIKEQGILNVDLVKKTWENYVDNQCYCTQIWNLLMFLQWCENNGF